MNKKKEIIVISLGGSLICPEEIDTKFLKTFVSLIKKQQKENKKGKIIIITGGGYICRQYLNAFDNVRGKTNTTPGKDYIGIAMTKVNAKLLQSLFAEFKLKLHPQLLNDPTKKVNWNKYTVAVGCGYLPGHSTDYDAVLATIANKATRIINLTNIDYVYTKDPRKYKNVKPIKDLTWQQYKKVLGVTTWKAGLHTPFDPLASKLAQKKKLNVIIVNGKRKRALQSMFTKFPIGTKIHF